MSTALSTENTLRKVGAHLRWMLEKEGINPETVFVCLLVDSKEDLDKLSASFDKNFDKISMTKTAAQDCVVVHGVPIHISVKNKEPK